jgi:signal transduction histidine kinase
MSLINRYLAAVRSNTTNSDEIPERSVEYWRNHYFSNTIAVVIPFSLIALVPGVLFCLQQELYALAALDVLSFSGLFYVAFVKGLSVEARKMVFMGITYFAASVLLLYVGVKGPGLLFLYAGCVFGLLILNAKYAYLWTVINVLICALFAGVLHYNLSPTEEVNETTIAEWIAIAVNLIFLSLLSSAMLPGLFKGLSKTIQRQNELQDELLGKTRELESSVREVKNKNEELEKFAYVASHDLQEPLRMITGFLSQLDRRYGDQLDDKARQYIQFASGGASKMRQIILDLLAYSRVSSEEHVKEQIEIQDIIEDYRSLRHRLITHKSATVQLDTPVTISGYKVPLIQVLHNLIDNALKYSKEDVPPEVHISASENPGHWTFAVNDNGIGIDPEYFDKIFILFQRLHAEDEYDGTGMGLAIVKKVIENLGGKIRVESQPEKGSTFIFTLPK